MAGLLFNQILRRRGKQDSKLAKDITLSDKLTQDLLLSKTPSCTALEISLWKPTRTNRSGRQERGTRGGGEVVGTVSDMRNAKLINVIAAYGKQLLQIIRDTNTNFWQVFTYFSVEHNLGKLFRFEVDGFYYFYQSYHEKKKAYIFIGSLNKSDLPKIRQILKNSTNVDPWRS